MSMWVFLMIGDNYVSFDETAYDSINVFADADDADDMDALDSFND
jgi:hypothetical protein